MYLRICIANVFSLQAFLAINQIEFNLLPVFQSFESFTSNGSEVNEYIVSGVALDKAISF